MTHSDTAGSCTPQSPRTTFRPEIRRCPDSVLAVVLILTRTLTTRPTHIQCWALGEVEVLQVPTGPQRHEGGGAQHVAAPQVQVQQVGPALQQQRRRRSVCDPGQM